MRNGIQDVLRQYNEELRMKNTDTLSPSIQSDIRMGRLAMNTMHAGMWFDKYDNVYCLGAALYEALSYDAKELLSYFEKPWKWEREWNLWEAWGKPTDRHCEGWQQWLDALDAPEDEEEAEEYYRRLDNEREEA